MESKGQATEAGKFWGLGGYKVSFRELGVGANALAFRVATRSCDSSRSTGHGEAENGVCFGELNSMANGGVHFILSSARGTLSRVVPSL